MLDCGDGQVASISMFDSREAAAASNERAAGWVRASLSDFEMELIDTTMGTTRVDVTQP